MRSAGLEKFDFALRSAVIHKDAFSDYYHVFLVPDEGFSRFIRVHDQLYSGRLKENLRLDIDFIPHLGIAKSLDKYLCKETVDHWNSESFEIKGIISYLTHVEYVDSQIIEIEQIRLK